MSTDSHGSARASYTRRIQPALAAPRARRFAYAVALFDTDVIFLPEDLKASPSWKSLWSVSINVPHLREETPKSSRAVPSGAAFKTSDFRNSKVPLLNGHVTSTTKHSVGVFGDNSSALLTPLIRIG